MCLNGVSVHPTLSILLRGCSTNGLFYIMIQCTFGPAVVPCQYFLTDVQFIAVTFSAALFVVKVTWL